VVAGTELDELIVADGAALRAWLLDNHTASPGVWLALTRKGGSVTTLTWQQAVDEARCFGWIDGQTRKRDEGVPGGGSPRVGPAASGPNATSPTWTALIGCAHLPRSARHSA
jgi:hypothetical protein